MSQSSEPYDRGRSMDLLYVFNPYFFENEYLHAGLWDDDLELKVLNLKAAQARYVEELFHLIPSGVETVLDVGCGSGEMALHLLARGYRVDCVCPPSMLSQYARAKLADRATVFECRFEVLDTAQRYDLICFSESFQFVNLAPALKQCRRYATRYVLIGDMFKQDTADKGPIGGGHRYSEFRQLAETCGFEEVINLDVSARIARNFDLERGIIQGFLKPVLHAINRVPAIRNSILIKMVLFSNRRRLARFRQRYIENPDRNSHSFMRYKTYRFMLFRLPN